MNRRQFFTVATSALVSLRIANQNALAKLEYVAAATPVSSPEASFELEDLSQLEGFYLGVLLTWLEMLEDSIDALYLGIELIEADEISREASAALLMPLGVWKQLAIDSQRFTGPGQFEAASEHAKNALDHLGSSAEIISKGIVEQNAMAITLGTEHINLGTEHIGLLIDSLPFARPRRQQILSDA